MTVTAFVPPQSPATTTHFQRPDRCEILNLAERKSKRQLLRMKWVVVAGNNSHSLSMKWITMSKPRL
jgi:ABC-type phosphonate transport system ATPase subunit